ncbi:hypothetical protein U3C50_001522 [Providencia rettgeri]|nr:hypothetical protein [Providencia rettgeri]
MNNLIIKSNKFLHYYLTQGDLNEEAYRVLTSLKPDEIMRWLSGSKIQMLNVVEKLSLVVKYQQAKLSQQHTEWLNYRSQLPSYDCLFSDAANFLSIPNGYCDKEQAINLLATIDRNQALIWAIRLNIQLPDAPIVMVRPECIQFIVNKVIDG